MNPGKLWTPVLKRSVHNIINNESSKEVSDNNLYNIVSKTPTAVDIPEAKSSTNYLTVPKSATKLRIGEDAADFFVGDSQFLTSAAVREGIEEELAYYTVNNAFNNIYASFGIPKYAMITLNLRKDEEENVLKKWIRNINSVCNAYFVKILGGHTCVSGVNENSFLSITAFGQKRRVERKSLSTNDYEGYRVIMTRPTGLEGTKLLIKRNFNLLKKEYSLDYLSGIEKHLHLSIKDECDVIYEYIKKEKLDLKEVIPMMHDISEGGVLAAFWEIGDYLSCGLEIDMEKILIKQLTIEICEILNINPYMLMTCGSLLAVTNKSKEILSQLMENGIPAVDIGCITHNSERILKIKDEIRFIEPFRGDSIHRRELRDAKRENTKSN